jgi:methyltransferase (TIGR00027 family)
MTQMVILGAGYDSRAYRFEGLKGRVKVFEVDHPATQKVKQDRVKRLLGTLPDHVVYVPIDFDREKLHQRLLESGYDQDQKTLFIWEGVTMYLTAEAVDRTLAVIAEHSGEASSVVFDYVYEGAVDGRLKGSEKWQRVAQRYAETPVFGIEQGTVERFLNQRGFDRVNDVSIEALTEGYLKKSRRTLRAFPFASIVHATVKPREGS